MEDRRSTARWVFLLGGGAIYWAPKKQTGITNSTMESEFVDLDVVGKEAEWLRNLIYEIPLWPKPISTISIRCDSAPTLAKVFIQVYNRKSRHLGFRQSMIRELIESVMIRGEFIVVEVNHVSFCSRLATGYDILKFVKTQLNSAAHLSKGLTRDLVHKAVVGMGLNMGNKPLAWYQAKISPTLADPPTVVILIFFISFF
ncbi:hypothetical protein LXL04_032477 [Taraxacum kok-saghyz]